MAASPESPSAPATGPAPARPDESVRVLLTLSRSLALLLAIVAGLLFLLFLAFALLNLVLGFGPVGIVAAVYCLVSAAVNYLLWREIPQLEQIANARDYARLRDRLLIWGILGLVFFVVVGVLLLAVWLKSELLAHPAPS